LKKIGKSTYNHVLKPLATGTSKVSNIVDEILTKAGNIPLVGDLAREIQNNEIYKEVRDLIDDGSDFIQNAIPEMAKDVDKKVGGLFNNQYRINPITPITVQKPFGNTPFRRPTQNTSRFQLAQI
jgi:hypothetical protein